MIASVILLLSLAAQTSSDPQMNWVDSNLRCQLIRTDGTLQLFDLAITGTEAKLTSVGESVAVKGLSTTAGRMEFRIGSGTGAAILEVSKHYKDGFGHSATLLELDGTQSGLPIANGYCAKKPVASVPVAPSSTASGAEVCHLMTGDGRRSAFKIGSPAPGERAFILLPLDRNVWDDDRLALGYSSPPSPPSTNIATAWFFFSAAPEGQTSGVAIFSEYVAKRGGVMTFSLEVPSKTSGRVSGYAICALPWTLGNNSK